MARVGVVVVGVGAPVDPRLDVLGRAAGPSAAVALAARTRSPVVALVATAVPDSGLVIAALAEHRVPVLAVVPGAPPSSAASSAGSSSAAALDAVRAGASGCVTAPVTPEAVLRTAAGEAVFSPGLATFVLDAHARVGSAPTPLTDREAEVLGLVVEGLTGRQIATRLTLSPRTVENHVQRVLRKLDLPNRAALVRYAIEHGLV